MWIPCLFIDYVLLGWLKICRHWLKEVVDAWNLAIDLFCIALKLWKMLAYWVLMSFLISGWILSLSHYLRWPMQKIAELIQHFCILAALYGWSDLAHLFLYFIFNLRFRSLIVFIPQCVSQALLHLDEPLLSIHFHHGPIVLLTLSFFLFSLSL